MVYSCIILDIYNEGIQCTSYHCLGNAISKKNLTGLTVDSCGPKGLHLIHVDLKASLHVHTPQTQLQECIIPRNLDTM